MRCFFMSGGHIQAVDALTASSDEEAVTQAFSLFRERAPAFDGFEVWDRARLLHRYPTEETAPKTTREGDFLANVVKRLTEMATDYPAAAPELRLLIVELKAYAATTTAAPSTQADP